MSEVGRDYNYAPMCPSCGDRKEAWKEAFDYDDERLEFECVCGAFVAVTRRMNITYISKLISTKGRRR